MSDWRDDKLVEDLARYMASIDGDTHIPVDAPVSRDTPLLTRSGAIVVDRFNAVPRWVEYERLARGAVKFLGERGNG